MKKAKKMQNKEAYNSPEMDYWEIILHDEEEEKPIPVKEYRFRAKNDVYKELVYHEVGHFIASRLIHKLKLNYNSVKFIEIKFNDNNQPIARVNGFSANIQNPDDSFQLKRFLEEDCRRLYADLINLIIAYTTYKVFIHDTEFFIGKADNMNNIDRYVYYKIIPDLKFQNVGIDDFIKVFKRLDYFNIKEPQSLELIHSIHQDCISILNNVYVKNAIGYLKNRFLEAPVVLLKGKKLRLTTKFVDKLLRKASLELYISKYENPSAPYVSS
jgi:hypothetical protein